MNSMEIRYGVVGSPVGPLLIARNREVFTHIWFQNGKDVLRAASDWIEDPRAIADAARQLKEYFRGERTEFDLPLAPDGTPFQRKVWKALLRIPYGETVSYGQVARWIGMPEASRAVGAANGRNPLPIAVPCHRVIGSSGKLTGYGGGLDIKEALLALERKHAPRASQLSLV
jgi:methylated-DNA-[protein]-cysteine S-methyltransferase